MERYRQRFEQFRKALKRLEEAVNFIKNNNENYSNISVLSNLIKQGLIQNFEFTHELGWKLLKDYLKYQGAVEIHGSRDAVREAFAANLITNGDLWMEMIKSRNETSHIYDDDLADDIFYKIINDYLPVFEELKQRFEMM